MAQGDFSVEVGVAWEKVYAAITEFAKRQKVELRWVYYDQMRLWANDLIKRFPPKSQGQGERRVAKDINRIFMSDTKDIDAMWPAKVNGQIIDAMIFKRKDGSIIGVDRALYFPSPSQSDMENHHDNYRDSRGHVTQRKAYHMRPEGRWKFIDFFVTPQPDIDAFIMWRQSHVGRLKAGWLGAANYWAAKSNGTVKADGYVTRHGDAWSGHGGDIGNDGSGWLMSANCVPYARDPHYQQIVVYSASVRQKDLMHWAQKRLDQLEARFNAGEMGGIAA